MQDAYNESVKNGGNHDIATKNNSKSSKTAQGSSKIAVNNSKA